VELPEKIFHEFFTRFFFGKFLRNFFWVTMTGGLYTPSPWRSTPAPRYREILERKKRNSESARDDSLIIDDESLQSNSYRTFEPAEEVGPERLAVNASSKDYDAAPKATIA
jgi:hypothetical protein